VNDCRLDRADPMQERGRDAEHVDHAYGFFCAH
jgi:hypothetical protein